jgi:hypothetical protein
MRAVSAAIRVFSLLYSQPGFTAKTPRDLHEHLVMRAA